MYLFFFKSSGFIVQFFSVLFFNHDEYDVWLELNFGSRWVEYSENLYPNSINLVSQCFFEGVGGIRAGQSNGGRGVWAGQTLMKNKYIYLYIIEAQFLLLSYNQCAQHFFSSFTYYQIQNKCKDYFHFFVRQKKKFLVPILSEKFSKLQNVSQQKPTNLILT